MTINVTFAAGDTDYVAKLNAVIAGLNAMSAGSFTAGPATTNGARQAFSVASNALTIAVVNFSGADASSSDPLFAMMRSVTASSSGLFLRTITGPLSLVVSSGSTLGHSNSDQRWVYTYLIDNAGTLELAVSSKFFGVHGIVSTTAEGGAGASDGSGTMYSSTARSNVPYLCIGRFRAPQTNAGVWLAVPTAVEGWPFETGFSQSAFLSELSVQSDNQTGDGTLYTIICDTEIRDQNADYNNATGTWTSPALCQAELYWSVYMRGLGAAHTSGSVQIITSNRTYTVWNGNPYAQADASGDLIISGAITADMDSADTAVLKAIVSGGAKTIDIGATSTKFGGAVLSA